MIDDEPMPMLDIYQIRRGYAPRVNDPDQVICAPWTRRDIGDMLCISQNLDWIESELDAGYILTESRHGAALREIRWMQDALNKKKQEYDAKAGFNPNQPRHPAGTSVGGQWSGGSGSPGDGGGDADILEGNPRNDGLDKPVMLPTRKPVIGPIPPHLRQVTDFPTGKRASAIYGETSGLTPQLKNPKGSPYDPENWDKESARKLAVARAYVGIVSERNPRVHFSLPGNGAGSIEARVWSDSVDAAIAGESHNQLDERVTNFFIRQEGVGRQSPETWPKSLQVIISVGPFNNSGGGDVPRGPKTYIDFYGKKE